MNLPGWDWKENILKPNAVLTNCTISTNRPVNASSLLEEFPHGVYIAVRVSKHLK
jgi:hypothetical protein